MPTIFLISDTHFGHANILNFAREDGTKLRQFSSVEEMDEHMVDRWNAVVRPQDHVYHLGDVVMKAPGLGIVKRLNGHLRLVRGNHDIFPTKKYYEVGFKEIYGVRVFEGLILSHIPLHPESLRRWTNVHGHLHNNDGDSTRTSWLGERYFNVSVECINYTPISLEELRAQVA